MVYLSACSFLYGARKSHGAEDLTPDVPSQDTLHPIVRFIIQCSVRIHGWECSEYDRVFAVLYGVSEGFATENLPRKNKVGRAVTMLGCTKSMAEATLPVSSFP